MSEATCAFAVYNQGKSIQRRFDCGIVLMFEHNEKAR